MKIHVHVLPIPSPGHPDPPMLFHYTTGEKLDQILRSGHILPTTAKIEPHERPVAWYSTSQQWEPTCSKVAVPGKLGQLMTAHAQGGLVRISVPATAAPHSFQHLPAIAGTTPSEWLGLLLAGLELGADPNTWRFTLEAVPIALFHAVESYDFATDRWHAVDLGERACRN
jgi:hypothetical protein